MADTDSYLSPEQVEYVLRMTMGGGTLGLGLGGASWLYDYLRGMNKKRTDADDDTLYVYKDKEQAKRASADTSSYLLRPFDAISDTTSGAWDYIKDQTSKAEEGSRPAMTASLATLAALAAGTGGYALVKKIESEAKRRQAQKELDDAQNVFLEAQGYKRTGLKKKASPDTSIPQNVDWLMSSGPTALALIALLSGAATYGYLDLQHPLEKKAPKPPRRIEVVDKPDSNVAEYDTPMPEYNKQASSREFVLHMIDAAGSPTSDIRNLVHAIAADGVTEFKKAASMMGFVNALNMVKGASAREVDPVAKHVAITYLAKSAKYGPQIGVVAAGEFAEMCPGLFKSAAALDPEVRDNLVKIAALFGAAIRTERAAELGMIDETHVKQASENKPSGPAVEQDAMEKWLNDHASKSMRPATKGDSSESTGTSGEEAGIDDPDSPSRAQSSRQLVMTGKTGRTHIDSNKTDIIDRFLNPEPETKKKNDPSMNLGQHGGFVTPII